MMRLFGERDSHLSACEAREKAGQGQVFTIDFRQLFFQMQTVFNPLATVSKREVSYRDRIAL